MTMKSPDELNARKEDAEPLNRKFHELTDEELAQVNGGFNFNLLVGYMHLEDQ